MVKQHTRRTPEQQIADLEEKIERVKQRTAAKAARKSPEVQAVLAYARAGNVALKKAGETGDELLVAVIAEAQAIVAGALAERGLAMPQRRAPRERKAEAA